MVTLDGLCVVLAILMGILALLRCPHAWEFVDKTEIDAPLEVARKCGVNEVTYFPWDTPTLWKRKVMVVIRCPNCGAAKVVRSD